MFAHVAVAGTFLLVITFRPALDFTRLPVQFIWDGFFA
jgi:hypothetical protein